MDGGRGRVASRYVYTLCGAEKSHPQLPVATTMEGQLCLRCAVVLRCGVSRVTKVRHLRPVEVQGTDEHRNLHLRGKEGREASLQGSFGGHVGQDVIVTKKLHTLDM